MASALIEGVVTVGKELWVYIYPKISNIIKFNTNLQLLRKEKDNLMNIVRTVKEQTAAAERGGHVLAPEVLNWLKDFEENQTKLDLLESKIDGAEIKCYKTCCSRCILGSDVAKQMIKVKRLVDGGSFPTVVVENFSVKKVEHIPGPSIVHQSTASKNLMKVLDLVNDERVNIIGVWGMGGVGKTTLVKNLNNMFETPNSDGKFSIIMWATASKDADIRSIQSQLLKRLNLKEENGENKERTAGRLEQRLKQEKRILFILDDVWEDIDLDYLGFSGIDEGNKIILTTRSMDVCRQMKTDVEVRVDVLHEDESWQLFMKNAGSVASLEHIEPTAKKINLECSGLPLAIIAVGTSMRGKKTIGLWEDALNAFQKSVPYIKGIKDKVYMHLMWSYDSLYFHNMNVKSCFLYCCLYPEDFSIPVNELVLCWIGEGLIDDSDSYEDMVNTGVSMVEYLKDSCLLEEGISKDTVKMHDVVRDVATWIATTLEDDCKSFVRSGFTTRIFSEEVFQENYRRVSLIDTSIRQLPNCSKQYPQVLSLILRGKSLPDIPEEFFLGLPGLRVLNLRNTSSTHSIPGFIFQLSELRTLLIQRFIGEYLPPVGNLRMLQVLDCSYSYLRTFPPGMEKLTNLRSLILLHTELHHIEDDVISKLTRLEILDMTGSRYKWDADGEKRTPFNELQCLHQLTYLSISFVMSSSSTADFSWLTRVKRFNLIALHYGENYPVPQRHYDKTVIFNMVEIGGVGFRSLLQTASCAVFINCIRVYRLWMDLDKGYSFRALKSLDISNCGWILPPATDVSSEVDLLPNLEELILHKVRSMESISQLMHCLGSSFSKLRTIKVSECYNLTWLFNSSDLIPTSENLEVVTVSYCKEFLGFYQNVATTNLKPKLIKLENLPNFSTLFGEQESWKKLEKLEVFTCDRIKKLPFDSLSATNIKEISGTQEWWNLLEWDDEVSKLSLQHYFKPFEDEFSRFYNGLVGEYIHRIKPNRTNLSNKAKPNKDRTEPSSAPAPMEYINRTNLSNKAEPNKDRTETSSAPAPMEYINRTNLSNKAEGEPNKTNKSIKQSRTEQRPNRTFVLSIDYINRIILSNKAEPNEDRTKHSSAPAPSRDG